MLIFKSIGRFLIIWSLTSVLGGVIGYLKNELDHKYRITDAWPYIQNYGFKSLLISSAIYLLWVNFIYFFIIKKLNKYVKKLWAQIIVIELITLFILPFFSPFNRFPEYLISFKEFWQYIFGLSSWVIAAALIPYWDSIFLRNYQRL